MKKSSVLALLVALAIPATFVANESVAQAAPPSQQDIERHARDALGHARMVHADALALYRTSTAEHTAANQTWSLAHWMAWRANRIAFDQLRILNDERRLGAHGKCMLAHSDWSTAVAWEQRASHYAHIAAELDKQAAGLKAAAADARAGGSADLARELDKRAAEKQQQAAADRALATDANSKATQWANAARERAKEANALEPGSCNL